MRKNYTHNCEVPSSRNELIDMLREKKAAIVINNELMSSIHTELNQEKKSAQKSGSTLKTAGVLAGIWAIFCSVHPVGWLIAGATALTAGQIKKLKDILHNYETYKGTD